jgi:hypothetical protein
MADSYNRSCSGGRDQENHSSKPAQSSSSRDPIAKHPTQKRAGRVAQVVELLPSKCESLSSNLRIEEKKKSGTRVPLTESLLNRDTSISARYMTMM